MGESCLLIVIVNRRVCRAEFMDINMFSVCSYVQAAGPVQCAQGLHSASARGGLLSGSGSHRCCAPHAYASGGKHTLIQLSRHFPHIQIMDTRIISRTKFERSKISLNTCIF